MVTIPFSFLPPKVLARLSDHFMGVGTSLGNLFPYLQLDLDRANFKVDTNRYLAMCIVANLFLLVLLSVFLTIFFVKFGKNYLGVVVALGFSLLLFFHAIKLS